MLFDLLHHIHELAHDLIGVCFAVVLLAPVLLASRVDLDAEDLNRIDGA